MTRHEGVVEYVSDLTKDKVLATDRLAAIDAARTLLPGELAFISPGNDQPLIEAIAARADHVDGGLVWKTGMTEVGPRLVGLARQQPQVQWDALDHVRRDVFGPLPWASRRGLAWMLWGSQVRVSMVLAGAAVSARYPGRSARSVVGLLRETSGFGVDTFPAHPTTELDVRWFGDGVVLAICYRDADGAVAVSDRHLSALELRFVAPLGPSVPPVDETRIYRLPPELKQSLLRQAAEAGVALD